jgi:hypothetical protein
VANFVQGRERLIAKARSEGREQTLQAMLKKTGAMDVEVSICGGSRRMALSPPEAWILKADFPALLLRMIPRTYEAYRHHLRSQVADFARIWCDAKMVREQTDEETCAFLAHSFYVQLFFQILHASRASSPWHGLREEDATPSPAQERSERAARVQASRALSKTVRNRRLAVLLRKWRQAAARLTFLRTLVGGWFWFARWPRRSWRQTQATVLRTWKRVTAFQAACRRFDGMLRARSYTASFANEIGGTLRLAPGSVLRIRNTFLELEALGGGDAFQPSTARARSQVRRG